jgi:hypothetical protein
MRGAPVLIPSPKNKQSQNPQTTITKTAANRTVHWKGTTNHSWKNYLRLREIQIKLHSDNFCEAIKDKK